MRLEVVALAILLVGVPLTGCLGQGEGIEETAAGESADPAGPGDAPPEGGDQQAGGEEPTSPATNASGSQARGEGNTSAQEGLRAAVEIPARSLAVVAHIDTGINPYHAAFRDPSTLGYVHPSRYIEGFPEDVPALNLTLDAPTYEEALDADAEVWESVERGQLYWIPGTRIIGAISMAPGGTRAGVEETPILDDHGHGTMT
ncbi:MAG: hypothetical protein R3185_05830, partial [Candidatus Thermoplasmatota archaeon]|nr:hypothetical protein [Candidatus Thermoplasmatota archaeon]